MKNCIKLLLLLIAICPFIHAQESKLEAQTTKKNIQVKSNIVPYRGTNISSILNLPVSPALRLKSNTQKKLQNLGAPTQFSRSSLLIDNRVTVLCTDKKPDSVENKNTVILNHAGEWVVSDNQGKDWYQKDQVINYDPEKLVVHYFPISGNEISLPVHSGEFYQTSLWYTTDLHPTKTTPLAAIPTARTLKRYAPYLIPIALGAFTLANQQKKMHDGTYVKKNMLPALSVNIAGVLTTASIINHKRRKQKTMLESETKPISGLQTTTTELIVPTLVIEIFSTSGELINKTSKNLISVGENWQATLVSQTIPALSGNKGIMVVHIENPTANAVKFSKQGFAIKQIDQNNHSNSPSLPAFFDADNNSIKKSFVNTAPSTDLTTPPSNSRNTALDKKFTIKNPLNGLSLSNIRNDFSTKLETAVSGFQLGSIIENKLPDDIIHLNIKLIDAIGNKAVSFKAMANQTLQEKQDNIINLKDVNIGFFDMTNNSKIGDLQGEIKTLNKNVTLNEMTKRYIPVLKKWAQYKGYEKLKIDDQLIKLTVSPDNIQKKTPLSMIRQSTTK